MSTPTEERDWRYLELGIEHLKAYHGGGSKRGTWEAETAAAKNGRAALRRMKRRLADARRATQQETP